MSQVTGGKLRVVSLPSLQLVAERSFYALLGNCVSNSCLGPVLPAKFT